MGASVEALSKAASQRGFLSPFLEGNIVLKDEEVSFGVTDLAIMETVLNAVEERENLLVVNPFHYPLVPVMISMSYLYCSKPLIPSRFNDGYPMLLFPKRGYIGYFDDFRFRRDIKTGRALVDKENVSAPEEFDQDHKIYRVTDVGLIRTLADDWKLGLILVDLRSERWRTYLADIEEFAVRQQVDSLVFYTDQRDLVADAATDSVDRVYEVSRSKMFEAANSSVKVNGRGRPTRGHREEQILRKPIDTAFVSVNDEGTVDAFKELYSGYQQIKSNFDDSDLPFGALRVFSLLKSLCVRPSEYDEAVARHGYFQSTGSRLASLRRRSDAVGGAMGDLLHNFVERADRIRHQLDEANPKRNVALDIVKRAASEPGRKVFVGRNWAMVQAFKKVLTETGIGIPDNIQIQEAREVEPDPNADHVFLGMLARSDRLYEFPPSNKIIFLNYPFEQPLIEQELDMAEEDGDTSGPSVSRKTIQVGGDSDPVDFEIEDLEEEAARSAFKRTGVSAGGSQKSGGSSESGSIVAIELADGSETEQPANGRITIFSKEENRIKRKLAKHVDVGERMVLLSGAASDLYEFIVDSTHEQEDIAPKINLVERWREILCEGLDTGTVTPDELLSDLQEEGSEIESQQTIGAWYRGDTLGPRDPDDVRRVLSILRPEYASLYREVHQAMKYIRILHQRIGHEVRRILESSLDPMTEAKLPGNVRRVVREVQDEIRVQEVVGVKTTG